MAIDHVIAGWRSIVSIFGLSSAASNRPLASLRRTSPLRFGQAEFLSKVEGNHPLADVSSVGTERMLMHVPDADRACAGMVRLIRG